MVAHTWESPKIVKIGQRTGKLKITENAQKKNRLKFTASFHIFIHSFIHSSLSMCDSDGI
jgi:hypothetical protein